MVRSQVRLSLFLMSMKRGITEVGVAIDHSYAQREFGRPIRAGVWLCVNLQGVALGLDNRTVGAFIQT
jgi:hypothetical protein